ncbi:galactose oxidase [Dichomitus squalens LYAD-421 SS1]|uniref:Galactose oxidase n=1 Tax=Dichomitus squalens (strain LYAD-421) TaxID=732165 RepID=R7SL39_DICSQ|nr:galactose oxidase [Dichomitus squalens LYAD-421 SS1]EJF56876.1 galactose oxidase [Dichomitus squalens LYAD-421 SS1]
MVKKKGKGKEVSKVTAKAAKKAKAAQKVEKKEKKKVSKTKDEFEDDDQDLESILDRIQREWEEAHKVTEELVEGPPSRRANATLTPCPNGNHLWCIGGEFFSEDGKAYFYSDVFRYSPEKNEWRKFVSPTCPGPRSAHAVVASPAGGGKLYLFGGEFSSLYQNSFHHYRDFWCFDISTHSWERIETKVRPTARSGHRMAMWKHYIVLFGGFYDPGIKTNYLNDLWIFDTQEYKWRQIEFRDTDRKPSPRSGFSFLPTADGILLYGGYCKEYVKGQRPVGVMLDDTWFLRMSLNTAETPDVSSKPSSSKLSAGEPLTLKWERRKKTAYAPSLRSGCTMALWAAKGMGVLFGGVTDEDTSEETMESVFHNDLYGYQIAGNGKWMSMLLKKPKKKVGNAQRKKVQQWQQQQQQKGSEAEEDDEDDEVEEGSDVEGRDKEDLTPSKPQKAASLPKPVTPTPHPEDEIDPDDPLLTVPLPRYNAMLAVLRSTLYIYGGIFEKGSREYTLDDFYALALDKLDRYVCLKKSDIVIDDKEESSDEDDVEDDDEEDDDDDETTEMDDMESVASVTVVGEDDEKEVDVLDTIEEEKGAEAFRVPQDLLRLQATAFMGVAKDASRSPEDVISTPLPGETLAMFYARSREYWAGKAFGTSDNRGKLLRRDGFTLAEDRYAEYKPILEEVERILAEAGLDEEEMRKGAAGGPHNPSGQSRNRR